MAEHSSFFNSVSGDRLYKAEDFAKYFSSFISNGIFPDPSTNLQVFASGNDDMSIIVKAGSAWINGYFYYLDTDTTFTIGTADGTLNRIDRIVVHLDIAGRAINVKVLKGVIASSPTAPTLQRDADGYDLALADIAINAGVTSISQSNITDQRQNQDLCGIVDSLITADTATLFNQFTDGFNTWFEGIKNTLGSDVAGNLLNKINDLAGDGRTTETVKGVSDALETHLAEKATQTTLGHVKIGSGINMDSNGVISVPPIKNITVYDEISFYVDSVNGNDDNSGSTANTALKTIQKAFDIMCTGEIIATTLYINCAPGTYSAPSNSSMQKVFSNIISISSTDYTNYSTNTFMNGYFDLDSTVGKTFRIIRFTFNASPYSICGQNQCGNVELINIKSVNCSTTCVLLGQGGYFYANNCELKGTNEAIDCEYMSNVTIEGANTKLTGYSTAVDLISVGSAKINDATLYTTSPDANFGALQASYGTTLYAKGIKGTLGASPVFYSFGSIIFKTGITATGAADVKGGGGQIFS